MHWTVVIPVRALPSAKSRLQPASRGPREHRTLVEAVRADTESAARAAAGVARVLLVTDTAAPAAAVSLVLVQHAPGLNAALREAAEHAAARWPDDGVAALVGDLPALRSEHLAAALNAAAAHARAFVADLAGSGTTLLTARPGTALRPQFGAGSAGRHARSAHRLDAGESLRADVDTADDLERARRLRLGPRTAAVLADRGERVPGVHLDVG